MTRPKNLLSTTTFHKGVIRPSLIVILFVTIISIFFPRQTADILNSVQTWIFASLNWVYVWAVTIFVLFLLFLMISKYGSITLGNNESKPEYSFFSWISMLFAAGMGIGLMYFGVAEPISHFSHPAFSEMNEIQRAKN